MLRRLVLAAVASLLVAPAVRAQTPGHPPGAKNEQLFNDIARLDSIVFDAYNRCDLEMFKQYFAEDLEFYHDNDGLSRGRAKLLESMQRNICGKVRRTLQRQTLGVYPLSTYGAVESGIHMFCDTRVKSVCDTTDGVGQFTMVWERRGADWVITRVLSYDHRSSK
ncbi:MAG: nuclear transport factor 2 family protein [bacterium]